MSFVLIVIDMNTISVFKFVISVIYLLVITGIINTKV